jgi:hypothetical protein
MPTRAVADLAEWDIWDGQAAPDAAEDRLSDLLKGEVSPDRLIEGAPNTPALTDDRPVNEYYMVRKWRGQDHGITTQNARR